MCIRDRVGIAIAISAIWAIKNMFRVDHQGWFNNVSGIYQLVSTIVVIASILIASNHLASMCVGIGLGLFLCLFPDEHDREVELHGTDVACDPLQALSSTNDTKPMCALVSSSVARVRQEPWPRSPWAR